MGRRYNSGHRCTHNLMTVATEGQVIPIGDWLFLDIGDYRIDITGKVMDTFSKSFSGGAARVLAEITGWDSGLLDEVRLHTMTESTPLTGLVQSDDTVESQMLNLFHKLMHE